MATHTTLAALFTDIANAIREKTGSTDPIVADDFPAAIAAIPTSSPVEIGSFTVIDDNMTGWPTGTYEFEIGMTWADFVSSEYNTADYYIDSSDAYGYIRVQNMDRSVTLDSYSNPTPFRDVEIVDGGEYLWVV